MCATNSRTQVHRDRGVWCSLNSNRSFQARRVLKDLTASNHTIFAPPFYSAGTIEMSLSGWLEACALGENFKTFAFFP
uniref:Uncharacterized protein n=1 Tax=Oryza nivara TaxID=4536 RepID=A0A0E0HUA4_ORYNI